MNRDRSPRAYGLTSVRNATVVQLVSFGPILLAFCSSFHEAVVSLSAVGLRPRRRRMDVSSHQAPSRLDLGNTLRPRHRARGSFLRTPFAVPDTPRSRLAIPIDPVRSCFHRPGFCPLRSKQQPVIRDLCHVTLFPLPQHPVPCYIQKWPAARLSLSGPRDPSVPVV